MDSEEIRRRRREKILARSGQVQKPQPQTQENPAVLQYKLLQEKEKYFKDIGKLKNLVICLLGVGAGCLSASGYGYNFSLFFIVMCVSYHFFSEFTLEVILPNKSIIATLAGALNHTYQALNETVVFVFCTSLAGSLFSQTQQILNHR